MVAKMEQTQWQRTSLSEGTLDQKSPPQNSLFLSDITLCLLVRELIRMQPLLNTKNATEVMRHCQSIRSKATVNIENRHSPSWYDMFVVEICNTLALECQKIMDFK